MSDQIVPLTSKPNQNVQANLSVDGKSLTLLLSLSWNDAGNFWVMTVADANGQFLVDQIPLLCAHWPAANLLACFAFLEIGSAYIINAGNLAASDSPNEKNLGTDFLLLWSDTPAY